MDITPFTTELRESLRAAAAVGDDATKSAVTALTAALEPAARLALLSALSAMAKEVTTQLADSAHPDERITVSVGLDGRDVTITTQRTWSGSHQDQAGSFAHSASTSSSDFGSASSGTGSAGSGWSGAGWAATGPASDDEAKAADAAARSFAEASGDLTRTTVRMFNELKGQAERAAAEQGVSLNSFISRAVADSIRGEKAARRGQRSGGGHGGGHGGHRPDSTISGYVQG
jgi:hypothetical protein